MFHKNIKDYERVEIKAGVNTTMQVLISDKIAPNFAMRKFSITPGGFMPLHKNLVEHEQYILAGKAEVQIGDKIITVEKDDVVFIPAGVEHNYTVIGDKSFEFLCIVPNKEDKIQILK